MLNKYIKSKQGLTLIEVILAIAIFGIIAIATIYVFTYGAVQVAHAGNHSEAVYSTQQKIEKALDGEVGGVITSTTPLSIQFGTNTPLIIPGAQYQSITTYNGATTSSIIKYFKPN